MNQPPSRSAPHAFYFETARLILRPFTVEDFSAVHAYASDEANTRYMLFDPNTEADTRAFLRRGMEAAAQSPMVQYECAVVLKTTGEIIGGCGIQAEDVFENGTAEVGWLLNRRFWRQGYGAEIGAFLLRLGFTQLGCHRIIARCDADNAASYGLMEKIGMRREGCFIEARQGNRLQNNVKRDELHYAILADEWHTQQEIAYYNHLPVCFTDFINFDTDELPAGDELLNTDEISTLDTLTFEKSAFDESACEESACEKPACEKPACEEPACEEPAVKKSRAALHLSDGVLTLVCVKKVPADPGKEHVPAYHFDIQLNDGKRVGDINLRIGYVRGLYYGGHIGYCVDEAHRGNGYAGRACKLLTPVIKAHGMRELLITNNHTNAASRRVCEKLGARLLRVARLPEWCDLYQEGQRFSNIFLWKVD